MNKLTFRLLSESCSEDEQSIIRSLIQKNNAQSLENLYEFKKPALELTSEDEKLLWKALVSIRITGSALCFSSPEMINRTRDKMASTVNSVHLFANSASDNGNPIKLQELREYSRTKPEYLQELLDEHKVLHPTILHKVLSITNEEIDAEDGDYRERLKEAQLIHSSIMELQNIFIVTMLPFVKYYLVRYHASRARYMSDQEMFSVGGFALRSAAERFDAKNSTFRTYASNWIRQQMFRDLYREDMIRIPANIFFEERSQELRRSLRVTNFGEMKTAYDDRQDFADLIASNTPSPEEIYCDAEHSQVISTRIEAVLKPREAEIIRARFGINPFTRTYSLQELGNKFEITRERVRQLEMKSLTKLRKSFSHTEILDSGCLLQA